VFKIFTFEKRGNGKDFTTFLPNYSLKLYTNRRWINSNIYIFYVKRVLQNKLEILKINVFMEIDPKNVITRDYGHMPILNSYTRNALFLEIKNAFASSSKS
jgi:hypothetical protein